MFDVFTSDARPEDELARFAHCGWAYGRMNGRQDRSYASRDSLDEHVA